MELKYLDESGFCAWSKPSYTYYKKGEQKRIQQTKNWGRRLSIVGLFEPLSSFVYGLVIGGVEKKSLDPDDGERRGRSGPNETD